MDTRPLLLGGSDQDEEDLIMGAEEESLSTQTPSVSQNNHHEDRREPLPRRLKLMTAGAIFVGNITFGTALNTYGPVLTSLQHKYGTDDATISTVFSIMTGCYMVGALCDSFMFKFINRQLTVIFLLGVMASIMFITPHCPTLATFFVSAGVLGFCSGSYDVAQFVWMMEMMQKECPPYVQSQHFFYAVGTVLPSLIMAPFLEGNGTNPNSTTTPDPIIVSTTPYYPENFIEEETGLFINAVESLEVDTRDKLFVPYTIIGCMVLVSMTLQALLFSFLRYREPPPEKVEEVAALNPEKKGYENGEVKAHSGNAYWPLRKILMVGLACSVYGAYQGMEMSTFQFFPKFGQNSDLHLSEAQSTYVLTGMNAAFAVGRGVAIIAVFQVSTQLILVFNLVVTLIANILLFTYAKSSLIGLWLASITFGIGFSSTYASFSAYIERYLCFTNLLGSMMLVTGSSVAAMYPIVIGSHIEDNPLVLSYVAFFSIGILSISISVLSYMTAKNKVRY